MNYTVTLLPRAYQEIDEVPARCRRRIVALIAGLATEPYPSRSKQLRGELNHLYRVPIDDWRIIYEVREADEEILIHHVRLKTGPETYEEIE